jgi:hypothetical protein
MSASRDLAPEVLAEITAAADEAYAARPGSPLTPTLAEQVRRILPRPAEQQEAA